MQNGGFSDNIHTLHRKVREFIFYVPPSQNSPNRHFWNLLKVMSLKAGMRQIGSGRSILSSCRKWFSVRWVVSRKWRWRICRLQLMYGLKKAQNWDTFFILSSQKLFTAVLLHDGKSYHLVSDLRQKGSFLAIKQQGRSNVVRCPVPLVCHWCIAYTVRVK